MAWSRWIAQRQEVYVRQETDGYAMQQWAHNLILKVRVKMTIWYVMTGPAMISF